jgi:hypothetical protein
VVDLGGRASALSIPGWPFPPEKATVVAVRLREHSEAAGFLVVGIHPGRAFDDSYRHFVRRIGLAFVQELVKLHGGSVRVESAVGQGSTFTVTIRRGTAHLPAERIHAARSGASTAVGTGVYAEEAQRWLPDEWSTADVTMLP